MEPVKIGGSVHVTFRGTCTHFRGVVPGVPHRAVLPNGNATRFGSVTFREPVTKTVPWAVAPHTASVVVTDFPRINWGRTIQCGKICRPVHLQIVNGTNDVHHDMQYDCVPSLSDFVPHFQYSTEVVLRGRALCYFDLRNGLITSPKPNGDEARLVEAHIETDGPPILRITELTSDEQPMKPKSMVVTLPEIATVTVSNVGVDCDKRAAGADFMLHFLTAAGGIPYDLLKSPPGWEEHDTLLCPDKPIVHPDLIDPCKAVDDTLALPAIHLSCSDSRYP